MHDNDTAEAHAIKLAYRLGFAAGEHALATRCEALEGAWKIREVPTWEQQVAERVAEYEKHVETSWAGTDNGAVVVAW